MGKKRIKKIHIEKNKYDASNTSKKNSIEEKTEFYKYGLFTSIWRTFSIFCIFLNIK